MGLQYLGQMLGILPSKMGSRRSKRRGRLPRHFILQHWRRRNDRGRSGRSVPHDGAAATADGLAGAGQRVGHQRPQLEVRFGDATTFAKAFPGIEVLSVDGTDWDACTEAMEHAIGTARKEQRPFMVHAKCAVWATTRVECAGEFYRDDLDEAAKRDPLAQARSAVLASGMDQAELDLLNAEIDVPSKKPGRRAGGRGATHRRPSSHRYAPGRSDRGGGERHDPDGEMTLMVDCALHAMQEIMEDHPEALLYGQDVGARLGGVFREADVGP